MACRHNVSDQKGHVPFTSTLSMMGKVACCMFCVRVSRGWVWSEEGTCLPEPTMTDESRQTPIVSCPLQPKTYKTQEKRVPGSASWRTRTPARRCRAPDPVFLLHSWWCGKKKFKPRQLWERISGPPSCWVSKKSLPPANVNSSILPYRSNQSTFTPTYPELVAGEGEDGEALGAVLLLELLQLRVLGGHPA